MEDEEESNEEHDGGRSQAELLSSYWSFVKRAIKPRWYISLLTFVVGFVITGALFRYLPRTYVCTTVMMAQGNAVLDGRDSGSALGSAYNLVMRHENLEALIRDGGLIQKNEQRRPPLLKLKDNLIKAAFGEMDDKTKVAALVGMLENKLSVSVEKGDLEVSATWTDGPTAAELAEAARESFLRARHTQEMSAFEEKLAVLDRDASKLREEVVGLAGQLKAAREEKALRRREEVRSARGSGESASVSLGGAAPRSRRPSADAQLPELTERLTSDKRKLAEMEGERTRRIREEQAKLDELRLRLTPSHPQVITQEERMALASQVPSELMLLRTEVKNLEAEVAQRQSLKASNGPSIPGIAANSASPLPPEFTQLLAEDEDADPALTSQYSSAYLRYGRMLDDISGARHDLNLAEVAFNHRYQIVIPADVPGKPEKPKATVILGAGFLLSLLVALLLPLLLELKRGVLI